MPPAANPAPRYTPAPSQSAPQPSFPRGFAANDPRYNQGAQAAQAARTCAAVGPFICLAAVLVMPTEMGDGSLDAYNSALTPPNQPRQDVNNNFRSKTGHKQAHAQRTAEPDGCSPFRGQIHHILPVGVYNRNQSFLFSELGLALDIPDNTIELPDTVEKQQALLNCQNICRPLHGNDHPVYSGFVFGKVDEIRNAYEVEKTRFIQDFKAASAAAQQNPNANARTQRTQAARQQFTLDMEHLKIKTRNSVVNMEQNIAAIITGNGACGRSINDDAITSAIEQLMVNTRF